MPRATRARPTDKNQQNQPPRSRRGGARPGAGRPRGRADRASLEAKAGIEVRAREHADVAFEALIDIATNGTSEPARVSAAMGLLGYGYGKPRQAVEHGGEGGGPIAITVTHRVIDPAVKAPHVTNGNGTKPRMVAR